MDPTQVRLSKHFLLSDFMGNHSVYTRGYRNRFVGSELHLANGRALCEHALEPILERHGPMSISYGYISPEMSQRIVTYQDPGKPSHHRWDLGAAADICVHGFVNGDPDDDSVQTAPVALAHQIDGDDIPYSRLITYSESPYLCIAVSDKELNSGHVRRAFYENRYNGKAKTKPDYYSRSTEAARARSLSELEAGALTHGWRGAGHPTYHGGGRRQFQHIRVSRYTMLSDWLLDLQSIASGEKNMPSMLNDELIRVFYAVGDAYDAILDVTGALRMSIIAGYVSPTNPFFDPANDWRSGTATFSLIPPEGMTCKDVRMRLLFQTPPNMVSFGDDDNILDITVKV